MSDAHSDEVVDIKNGNNIDHPPANQGVQGKQGIHRKFSICLVCLPVKKLLSHNRLRHFKEFHRAVIDTK